MYKQNPVLPKLAIGALITTGAVHYLLAPPYGEQGWIFLHPLAWIPALAVFSQLRGWRAFAAGWLVGSLAELIIYTWMIGTVERFTQLSLPGALAIWLLYGVLHGLATGVFAWGVVPLRRSAGSAWPFAVAAWFVVCEHWGPNFFPYTQGAGWVSVPEVFLLASQTGVAGVSFMVFLTSGLGLLAIEAWQGHDQGPSRTRRPGVSGAAGILVIGLALSVAVLQETRIAAAEASSTPLRVALVQDNRDNFELLRLHRADPYSVARELVELSEAQLAVDPGIRVVLWPEGALRSPPNTRFNRQAVSFAERHGVELWTGAMTKTQGRDPRVKVYNSAYRINEAGKIDPPYHKNILVPISEARPDFSWLPSLPGLVGAIAGTGQISAGEGPGLFDTPWGPVAFLICYEAILPESVRSVAKSGTELIANFTYDAWFGNTRELDQHLAMARAQAVQVGIPMLRVTTTGISAIIDARGRVTARGGRYTPEVVVGDVRPLHASGLYARIGPWFAWVCTLVALVLLWRGRRLAD